MRAEFLRDEVRCQAMSVHVPVSIPKIFAKSVQEDFVLIGIGLHRFSQIQPLCKQVAIKYYACRAWPDAYNRPLEELYELRTVSARYTAAP